MSKPNIENNRFVCLFLFFVFFYFGELTFAIETFASGEFC